MGETPPPFQGNPFGSGLGVVRAKRRLPPRARARGQGGLDPVGPLSCTSAYRRRQFLIQWGARNGTRSGA